MIELRNERDFPKLIDNENNLKELIKTTKFCNAYIVNLIQMSRVGEWVDVISYHFTICLNGVVKVVLISV